jgi:hypothetical protein
MLDVAVPDFVGTRVIDGVREVLSVEVNVILTPGVTV